MSQVWRQIRKCLRRKLRLSASVKTWWLNRVRKVMPQRKKPAATAAQFLVFRPKVVYF